MEVRVNVEGTQRSVADSGLFVSFEVGKYYGSTWLEETGTRHVVELKDAIGWVREQLALLGHTVTSDFVFRYDENVLVAEVTEPTISRDLVMQIFSDLGVPDATSVALSLVTNSAHISHGTHTQVRQIEEA